MTAKAELCPTITVLSPEEPTRFNPDRLEELCLKIGEVQAEAKVALALHRISELLPNLKDMLDADPNAFIMAVDQLGKDADLIGMLTLARVARNVQDSFSSANDVALSATLARLERVGGRPIHAVWDREDMPR